MNALSPRQFVTGGNATFTVLSKGTGTRFTFKVKAPKESLPDKPIPLFVKVLTGSDNENDYTFLGSIFGPRYQHGRRSSISPNAKSAQAFEWFWRNVDALPADKVEFIPSGKCCCCNRTLTTPTSVALGYGPECAKKLGF